MKSRKGKMSRVQGSHGVLTVNGMWVELLNGMPDGIRPLEHRV